MPILDAMLEEQKNTGCCWSPSNIIQRLGKEINNEDEEERKEEEENA